MIGQISRLCSYARFVLWVSRIRQGAYLYEVTSCAFKVNEPVGPAALKTLPKVKHIWQDNSKGQFCRQGLILCARIQCQQGLLITFLAISRNLLHFKPSARQVLQALKEGMCEVWSFSMQFAHTDLIAKQSLQLIKHGDLQDNSFRLRN